MKKQPKQQRSRQIVDAVLAGATRILSQRRLQEVTTNKIAEIAGVGIGSLYDYFPNKNAIINSLMDRHVSRNIQEFKQLLESDPEKTLDEKVEDFVGFIEKQSLRQKDFLREIFMLAPENGKMEALYRGRMEITEPLAIYLQTKIPQLSKSQANQKAFVLVHGVIGIIESYVMLNPNFLSVDDVMRELRDLMHFLLRKPA